MKTAPLLAGLSFAVLALTASAEPSERAVAYKTFRENFDARRFAEALPSALQVVELSEKQYGPEQVELVVPLQNLATTQLRLADFAAAELTFLRAIKIVETREGGFSRDIIQPLMGLGVTYLKAGQYSDAVTRLKRAIDVSRRVDGLFNARQIELVDPLIQSYLSLELYPDMEREQQYLLRLSESSYGKDDLRMLPALERSAYWYEEAGRYYSARLTRAREVEIILKANKEEMKATGKDVKKKDPKVEDPEDVRLIGPLRGIARAYRLEYIYGMGSEDAEMQEKRPSNNTGATTFATSPALDDSGRRALERALKITENSPQATIQQRAETRIDLGDWFLAAANKKQAMEAYKKAWTELSGEGAPGTTALAEPVQVVYRGPTGSMRRPPAAIEDFDRHYVEVEFTVAKDGEVIDVKVAEADGTEAQKKAVVSAVDKGKYRPKFVNGEPVDTAGVRFRQVLFTKKKS